MSETTPGLQCPNCGCAYSRVSRTRGIVDGIARRRRCADCNQPYSTHETKVEEKAVPTRRTDHADHENCPSKTGQ